MKLIELQDIFKTYRLGEIEVPVLRGVSLSIRRGEFVALMGSSGSGKTTLMNILGCLDRPTSGRYSLDGEDVGGLSAGKQALLRNQKIGFVFQNFNLLSRTSALDNVMMPLSYADQALSDRDISKRAQELLQRVGLGERFDHEPSQLSGGQQQRVAIARALINRPPLLFADEPTGNLDSSTSEEVLHLFQRLNREEGVTIIIVTHDENVAQYAERVIRIRDGVIEDEGAALQRDPRASDDDIPAGGAAVKKAVLGGVLHRARRVLRTSLNGLRRNVMRAALTTLGIIIGVASVIAMMEIGHGSSTSIQRSIASMGATNLLIVNDGPAVRGAAPVVRARTQVVYGNRNWVPSSIYGTTPAFLEVREWPLAEGNLFTDREVRNGSKVCLLGRRIVVELFQGESPLGKEVRVNNVPLKVIGILSSKGANMMGMDQDDILLAPWTTIKYRVTRSSLGNVNQSAASSSTSDSSSSVNTLSKLYPGGQELYPLPSATQAANTPLPVRFANIDQIMTAARSTDQIPEAVSQITRLLRERHRLGPEEPDDFNIRDMTEMTRTLSSTAMMMTNLLLVVALISLVVGGVGIMNIMLVSVTERTREIGLRMAVGAQSQAILQQFLAESIVLCFCGGMAGILVGRGASYLVSTLLQWPTEISLGAIVAAFAVSATVGIVFGYYPAWKASRLDPIIALRYE